MSAPVMMACALLLSVLVAGLILVGGDLLDRRAAPPLRARLWGWSQVLAALPPVVVAIVLLGPAPLAPETQIPAAPVTFDVAAAPVIQVAPVAAPAFDADIWIERAAVPLLAAAGLLALARLVRLALRVRRMRRLIVGPAVSTPALTDAVRVQAAAQRLSPPPVRILNDAPQPMLAGWRRPVLILPPSLDDAPAPVRDAVIAHELAHLRRKDHRALWHEEILAVVLAINPLLGPIRRRAAAAREEACDALALIDAPAEIRRDYARLLIGVLRGSASAPNLPVLTFTGHERNTAMRRLNAALTPPAATTTGVRRAALGLGLVAVALTGAGSLAVAAQREPAPAEDRVRHSNWEWTQGALTPIYRSAWTGACGFGRSASEGGLFIHLGDGCTGAGIDNPNPLRINGVDLKARPRQAFEQVRTACATGAAVAVAYRADGRTHTVQAVCDRAAVEEFAALSPNGPLHLLTFPAVAASDVAASAVATTVQDVMLLNGRPLPAGLPVWALAPEGIDMTTQEGAVDFILTFSGATPVSVNGARMPEGFPARGIAPEAVARVDIDGDHVRYVLRTEEETRAARAAAGPAQTAARAVVTPRPAAEAPVAPRAAYATVLTIRDNGRIVASARLRVRPDDAASAVLNTEGRDYQFDLYLEGPDGDPEGRMVLRADIARTADAGGWEPLLKPNLAFRPDGQARMTWGEEAGLLIDIIVEPA